MTSEFRRYALVPAGPQKVYTGSCPPVQQYPTRSYQKPYFNSAFLTMGPHFIRRRLQRLSVGRNAHMKYVSRFLGSQVAYTYSAYHHLNILTVMINFNGDCVVQKSDRDRDPVVG